MASHRILIVEDHREVSRLLRSALETLEYELEIVEIPSGEEAILYSSRHNVDLLVADYLLPGMTGLELMKKVRNNHPQAKIFLITGQSDPKIRRTLADAGADAFFTKPVEIADFLDAVERHLGLIQTFLPPEPIAVEPEDRNVNGGDRRLPDLLVELRQKLKAYTVLLMDDTGHVLARAGDLPNPNAETALLSSLLSVHSASQKASRLLGYPALSSWTIFDGDGDHLIFAPVGDEHSMVVLGKNIADESHIKETLHTVASMCELIQAAIVKFVPAQPKKDIPAYQEPSTTPLEVVEQNVKELEPLLQSKKKIKTDELNQFWEEAADQHWPPSKPDMLSYEQAKQLGLAPEEDAS